MRKRKLMQTAAAAMACMLTLQAVNLPSMTAYAENDAAAATDDTAAKDFIGNLSAYELSQVQITDGYLTNAQDKDIEYLLSLDSDKLLAGFRETAGLDMNGAARYSGWENSLIGGHTMGHYLTAMAQAVQSLPESDTRRAQVIEKLNYIIDELKKCQDSIGTGYIFGATLTNKSNIYLQFDNVEKGQTNITTQAWVPWYTMHKILAGLVDTYKYTGNETALTVAKGLGNWVYDRTNTWSAATRNTVLSIEYGGMNDCLYELYSVTGEEKYAVAAHQFDEDSLFKSVASGNANVLNNKHANTTIPKFLGALNRYVTTNGKTINGETVDAAEYLEYAEKFFDMVNERHTYITGDNSEWEHFGADNILDAERTNCNCETCNAYNMLKLAKALYMITGDSKYTDFYENTFYNTILSSQNPDTGMTTYFQPMATGYFKVYTTETNSFWCCTGSGMENFTKLGGALYYSNENMVVVSGYFSSVLTDNKKNIKLTQEADIPSSDTVKVTVNTLDGSDTVGTSVALRLPSWLADETSVQVNGSAAATENKSGYAIVSNLKNGDVITITLPMDIKAYNLPDGESTYGFKYGPVVLSAKLGTEKMDTTFTGVSVIIPAAKLIENKYISDGSDTVSVTSGTVADFISSVNDNLVKTDGKLEWTLDNTDANLTFVPHYSQHTERYGIYFNYVSNTGAINAAKYINQKAQERLDAAKTDTVQPGYGQYENDDLHSMKEEGNGSVGDTSDGTSRYAKAGGSFTYTMKVSEGEDNYLQMYFRKADNDKTVKVSVGDSVVYDEVLDYSGDDEEYMVRIPVKKSVVTDAMYEKEDNTEEKAGKVKVVDVKIESGKSDEDSARVCSFIYMTKAYGTNATMTLEASAGKLSQDGNTYTLKVDGETDSVDLTATIADTYGYIRINDTVVRETAPYTVDLTSNNHITLVYKVYAEDHETTNEYTVVIDKDVDIFNRTNADRKLAYFVDCGDFDVNTLSDGDLFGVLNGVTDQAYGEDPVTGYKWGIVDSVSDPLKNGMATNVEITNAAYTDNTWPFETDNAIKDGAAKTSTNRYTKNQFENGIARNLNYDFELPNGEYEIELYFTDPWNCSKNPIVSAEGATIIENADVNKAVTGKVKVEDGTLSLNITSPDATLCLNLAYIKIYMPEDILKSLESASKTAEVSNGVGEDNSGISATTVVIIVCVVVVVIVAAAVVVVVSKKKKKAGKEKEQE